MDPFALRVGALWGAWLLVMLFHVELGLMPLFHGCSVEIKTQVRQEALPRVFLAMLIYFVLPVLAMLLAIHAASEPLAWTGTLAWRIVQFVLATFYTLTNIGHLIADVRIPASRSDHVLLMVVLIAIGVLLNWETWRWWQS